MFIQMLLVGAALAAEPGWDEVVERVLPAVVSLRLDTPRAFETDAAGGSVATGFVVDAEQGIILTNRHVVGPGPVVARAIFQNHEEAEVRALYRDPVHDFGFFQVDPKDVRFMELQALPLAPQGAAVGIDIRVVGSDAGEKLSILPGTIARLDRSAPSYGRGKYNDFNTFYLQAASGTSGGSSGSPVIDRGGRAVALNAGARREAATSFFLPLDRVVRALDLVRRGQPVPRGTLQVVFRHVAYDEARRLGLAPETEAELRARDPAGTGLLMVDEVVPGGPGSELLRTGDLLVRAEGEPLTGFLALESLLDQAVGEQLVLQVQRGGAVLELAPVVQDLHGITPTRFLELGGGVVQALSYQHARSYGVPVAGVYVASPGYGLESAKVRAGALITELAGEPIGSLDDLVQVLESLPEDARVPLRHMDLSNPTGARVGVYRHDRRWFPARDCAPAAVVGRWDCRDLAAPPAAEAVAPAAVTPLHAEGRVARKLAQSLVMVDFAIPYRHQGVYGDRYRGTGVVVDLDRGWVLVDRDTVPVAMGDLTLVLAGSVEVPAQVFWLHPTHNLAVVQTDPRYLHQAGLQAAVLRTEPLELGDPTWHVGLNGRLEVVSRRTSVVSIEPLSVPLPSPPFFRPTNVEIIEPGVVAASTGGVLADKKGRVGALWASYVDLSEDEPSGWFSGLPVALVAEALTHLRRHGLRAPWPGLGIELGHVPLSDARHLGLDAATAAVLEAHDPARRQALRVVRRTAGSPAAAVLEDGDLVLRAGGAPVTRFRELERAIAAGPVSLDLLRGGERVEAELLPHPMSGLEVTRAVGWSGALFHEAPEAVAAQRGRAPEGVYIAWYWFGSPASRHGLRATRRVVAVDDSPTPDLDSFLAAISDKPPRTDLRLHTRDLDGRERVLTLTTDPHYWPTFELQQQDGVWRRVSRP